MEYPGAAADTYTLRAALTASRPTDKVIWDVTCVAQGGMGIGISGTMLDTGGIGSSGNLSIGLYGDGTLWRNGVNVGTYLATGFQAGTVVGVKYNPSTKQIWFSKNGGAWGSPYTHNLAHAVVYPAVTVALESGQRSKATVNFLAPTGSINSGFYKIGAFDNLVVSGDSWAYATYFTAADRYSTKLAALLSTAVRAVKMTNTGYEFGQTSLEEVSRYANDIRTKLSSAARTNILITIPTTSDLTSSGRTVAQMIASHQTFVTGAVADGWTVILGTMPGWHYGGTISSYVLDTIAKANQHDLGVEAITGKYAIFDIAANATIGLGSDYTNSTYFNNDDIPHPKPAGTTSLRPCLSRSSTQRGASEVGTSNSDQHGAGIAHQPRRQRTRLGARSVAEVSNSMMGRIMRSSAMAC